MKIWNKWSFRIKWLVLSAVITISCVYAGFYISRELTERDRHLQLAMGPHEHHLGVMQELVKSGKFSATEAFKIVERKHSKRTPFRVFLLDTEGRTVDSNPPTKRDIKFSPEIKYPLGPDHFIAFGQKKLPRSKHGGPSSGTRLIISVTISVSIIVGIALSILFLTLYLRRKSSEAEAIISKLKSGDLKARFVIHDTDEANQLMLRFNEMADQIEKLVTNLRQTEQARMIMLQELAHDLRTPVASLKQFQEILLHQGQLLDEEKKIQTLLLAMKEVNYFEHLVEDLLFLSGVNDPRYSGNFSKVNLADLVKEEIERFESGPIQFLSSLPEKAYVKGDPHLLQRLIRNAFSNAERFAKKQITIELKESPDNVLLEVQDDGPGMESSILASFGEKKYSRQFLAGADSKISIGLGSVIMKKIVSLHDGSLEAKNRNGLLLSIQFPRY